MAQNVHGCRTNVKLLKTVGVLAKNPVNMKKVVIVHILPCKITTFFIFTGDFAGAPPLQWVYSIPAFCRGQVKRRAPDVQTPVCKT